MPFAHDNNLPPAKGSAANWPSESAVASHPGGQLRQPWRQPFWRIVPLALILGGCAGYQLGTRSLYAPNITTVYVPMFESDSFRPHLGQWLTEAVVKQIELKTPYKVVDSVTADSVLTGRILSVRKGVQIEDPYDNPRAIEVDFKVEVSWVDRHGGMIRSPSSIALPAALVHFGQASSLVPEGGQSIATANQEAIAGLAEQIVSTMEVPW